MFLKIFKRSYCVLLAFVVLVAGCVSAGVSHTYSNGGNVLSYSGNEYLSAAQSAADQSCAARFSDRPKAKITQQTPAPYGNTYYGFVCQKPEASISAASPVIQSSPSLNNTATTLDDAKKKCSELGLKSGTEAFGKCVLQLSK